MRRTRRSGSLASACRRRSRPTSEAIRSVATWRPRSDARASTRTSCASTPGSPAIATSSSGSARTARSWCTTSSTTTTGRISSPREVPRWIYLSSVGSDGAGYYDQIVSWLDAEPSVRLAFQPGTFQIALGAEALSRALPENRGAHLQPRGSRRDRGRRPWPHGRHPRVAAPAGSTHRRGHGRPGGRLRLRRDASLPRARRIPTPSHRRSGRVPGTRSPRRWSRLWCRAALSARPSPGPRSTR